MLVMQAVAGVVLRIVDRAEWDDLVVKSEESAGELTLRDLLSFFHAREVGWVSAHFLRDRVEAQPARFAGLNQERVFHGAGKSRAEPACGATGASQYVRSVG